MDNNKNIKVSIIITYSRKTFHFLSLSFGSNMESWTCGREKSLILLRQLESADWFCLAHLTWPCTHRLHTIIFLNFQYFLLSPQPHLNIVQQGFPELRQSFVVKSLYFSLGNFRAVLELLLRLVPAHGVRSGDAPAASCPHLIPLAASSLLGRALSTSRQLFSQSSIRQVRRSSIALSSTSTNILL